MSIVIFIFFIGLSVIPSTGDILIESPIINTNGTVLNDGGSLNNQYTRNYLKIQDAIDNDGNITGWYEQAKLLASDGAYADGFGCSVSLDGDTALIGAPYGEDNGEFSGSAYIFKYDGLLWNEEVKILASDVTEYSNFGFSVSLDGDKALIGAIGDNEATGSAYVFKRNGSNWEEEAKLIASDGADSDLFGDSVFLDGNTALVGSPSDDDNGDHSGSAYVFKYDGIAWKEEAKLLASDGGAGDTFGISVSLDGDYAIISAHQNDSAYIFKRNGSNWEEEAKLNVSDGEHSMFGISVSLDGDTALIGAIHDDDNGHYSGSAYVFKRNGINWFEEVKLTASDGSEMDMFGSSVSLDGDTALIGAFHDNDCIGSAYVFKRNGTIWTEQRNLHAAYEERCFWFGDSVSLDGDTALIGAKNSEDVNRQSVAYIFEKGLGPDLTGPGIKSLDFSDVPPNSTFEGNFTFKNIGEAGSNLEWEITEYPEWGNWTFDPMSGVGLTPEAGSFKVNFTVVAPDNETEEFSGILKVVNKHDRDDYYNLSVNLKTPRNKPLSFYLLSWFLERFPLLERLLNLLIN